MVKVATKSFVERFSKSKYCDPPLTNVGVAQSTLTGMFLKKQIDKNLKSSTLVIKSSPFLSCIMTACTIAYQFGQDRIEIDANLSQAISGEKLAYNPIPHFEIYKCHTDNDLFSFKRRYRIDQNFKLVIDQVSQNELECKYPETQIDTKVRFIENWFNNKKTKDGEKTAIINVTDAVQVSWAASLNNIASQYGENVKFLEEIAKFGGQSLKDEERDKIENEILKSDEEKGKIGVCAISAGLHWKDSHQKSKPLKNQAIFDCNEQHLTSRFANEQMKFLLGRK